MVKTYDVPPSSEVLQGDVEEDRHIVDVNVTNIVRTDEMPTITYYRNVILSTGDRAQPVLQANPRRKKAILWGDALGTGADVVCIGSNEGQATNFSGAMLFVTSAAVPLRYEINDANKVWARGCIIGQTGGTWTGFVVSTDDIVLSIIEECWAE